MIVQHPGEVGRLLAVDLDETLVDVNTFPLLVRALPLALVRAGRPLAVVRLVIALVRRKALRGAHANLKSTVSSLSEIADGAAIDRWASSVLERHGDPCVMATIAAWDGPCLLTSAAPQTAVERFAHMAGCSTAHGSRGGESRFEENVGATKVERLLAAGFAAPALAISDDAMLDAPLLGLADRSFVVDDDRTFMPFDSPTVHA